MVKNKPNIRKIVDKFENTSFRNKFLANCLAEFPKSTMINQALRDSVELKRAIWKEIGLDEDLMLPSFKEELLFPILSSTAHSLGLRKVYLRSDLDPVMKVFLESLATLYKRKCTDYDAETEALAADEIIDE